MPGQPSSVREGATASSRMDVARLRRLGDRLEPTFCRVITEGECKLISGAEYHDYVSTGWSYDLFINGLVNPMAASRRDPAGKAATTTLSTAQFHMLVQYVLRRVPLRPKQVAPTLEYATRVFEKARRLVDVEMRRYAWRSFVTIKGDSKDAKAFQFSPPADLTFCVLLPLTILVPATIADRV